MVASRFPRQVGRIVAAECETRTRHERRLAVRPSREHHAQNPEGGLEGRPVSGNWWTIARSQSGIPLILQPHQEDTQRSQNVQNVSSYVKRYKPIGAPRREKELTPCRWGHAVRKASAGCTLAGVSGSPQAFTAPFLLVYFATWSGRYLVCMKSADAGKEYKTHPRHGILKVFGIALPAAKTKDVDVALYSISMKSTSETGSQSPEAQKEIMRWPESTNARTVGLAWILDGCPTHKDSLKHP
ncbi:hypothetical protein K438DRAFT_1937854 [Mycena galopus ATCC 62051]|nr:hypothetical protein K438DRAFT_1937854 [Mycena galopus ATCC 62051]